MTTAFGAAKTIAGAAGASFPTNVSCAAGAEAAETSKRAASLCCDAASAIGAETTGAVAA